MNKNDTISITNQNETESENRIISYFRLLGRIPKYIANSIRTLAYISQVGESMRNIYPILLQPLYALSISYILVDIAFKNYNVKEKSDNYRKFYFFDISLWHIGASLLIPMILVRKSIFFSTMFFTKLKFGPKSCLYVPSIITISLLPFLIDPIDKFTDLLMDSTYRKRFNYKDFENELTSYFEQNIATDEERIFYLNKSKGI